MALKVEVCRAGDVAVFHCRGEIVFGAQAAELHVAVKGALAATGKVVLELAGLPHLDSAGVGTLFSIYTSSVTHRGKLRLACLTPRVRQILTHSKLLNLVEAYESEAEAVRAFSEARAG